MTTVNSSWLSMTECLNCDIYSWGEVTTTYSDQENLSEQLLMCSKCKVNHYCGRDCQLEHWKKVHKKRCKYLSRDEEQVVGVHRHLQSICRTCNEESGESHWPCHMQSRQDFWDNPIMGFRGSDGEHHEAPLAVELGELTGQYTSRMEHVVSVLQKILHLMDVTGHPVSKKEYFKQLTDEVFTLRHESLMTAATLPPGRHVDFKHSQFFCLSRRKQEQIPNIIKNLSQSYEEDINDVFRLWHTFILIFDYFFDEQKDKLHYFQAIGRKASKNKKVKMLLSQVEKSDKIEEKWDKVVLSCGPAPFTTILEIVAGNLKQKCSKCKERIVINGSHSNNNIKSINTNGPVALCWGILLGFHCGKISCRSDVWEKYFFDCRDILLFVGEDVDILGYEQHRCDWCMILTRSVHRCLRCLTKVYCSQECLQNDWQKVHKDLCKEEPDGWKIKLRKIKAEKL